MQKYKNIIKRKSLKNIFAHFYKNAFLNFNNFALNIRKDLAYKRLFFYFCHP